LGGEPFPQSDILSALKQVFIKDLSIHLSGLDSQSLTLKNTPTA
jgi:hypothetical protein